MPKFMLILQNKPGTRVSATLEERQRRVERYNAWVDCIRANGRYVSSEKLGEEGGKVLDGRSGQITVMDGPYIETNEVVAGYFVLRAADYHEAIAITRECPFLDEFQIAIRQTDPMGCGGE
ncbi:MAG: YciI family protein [Isosphaeraceae bacterium]